MATSCRFSQVIARFLPNSGTYPGGYLLHYCLHEDTAKAVPLHKLSYSFTNDRS
jgi:hypothetical protein